jgi:hypothetical protein
MRPEGQPPSSRIVRGPSRPPSRRLGRRGRRYRSDNAHLLRERHIYRHGCSTAIQEPLLCNLCCGQQPNPTQRAGSRGGRNARATGTRSRAFSIPTGNSRSRIAGLPPASPQSSFGASLEVPTYSVETLCGRSFRVATEKHS